VLDKGVGIKTKNIKRLFTAFECLDDSRKLNTQGVGLGLNIVKMITAEFGGSVAVQSKNEVGSIFQASVVSSKTFNTEGVVTLEEGQLRNRVQNIKSETISKALVNWEN
jgi:signal transduction histidine kinase